MPESALCTLVICITILVIIVFVSYKFPEEIKNLFKR